MTPVIRTFLNEQAPAVFLCVVLELMVACNFHRYSHKKQNHFCITLWFSTEQSQCDIKMKITLVPGSWEDCV